MLENRSIPGPTIIPELPYPDVTQAADWLCAAFGFTIRLRIANHRAQLQAGPGGALVVVEGSPETGRQSTLVRVEDASAHCEHARAHGARIVREPTDYPYGERQYKAEDFHGHRWTFSQTIADVDPQDWLT